MHNINEFAKNICENLFFAFTTGAIMMWFQNSVDGYSQMRDSYREIELYSSNRMFRSIKESK